MTGSSPAWADFWDSAPAGKGGATLAQLPAGLQARLDAPWLALATALPRGGRVLDLATGGGVVLARLYAARRDLRLTGVDRAPSLRAQAGMRLMAGIANEQLPFADASFDAVTSRFGIEYGALDASAAEAARVMRPHGLLRIVAHHADSAILRHNRDRGAALRWARQSEWIDKAMAFARARRAMPLPVPPAFAAAPGEAARRYPDQPVAWEFLTGLAQVLHLTPAPQAEAALQQLAAQADLELARLDALSAAALDAERLGSLTDALAAADIALGPVAPIVEAGGTALAWSISGTKRA